MKHYVFFLLLFLVCSQIIPIVPPGNGAEKSESPKVIYNINLNHLDDKAYLLIKIKPKEKDNFKGVYVSKNSQDPSFASSQYKCIESPCYLWLPVDYYSKVNSLSMSVECKANCDYYYRFEYVDDMFIEDNTNYSTELEAGVVEVKYPLAEEKEDIIVFMVSSAGKEDITLKLTYSKHAKIDFKLDEKVFAMEKVFHNGYGVIIAKGDYVFEDKAFFTISVKANKPTVIRIENRIIVDKQAPIVVSLLDSYYSFLNIEQKHESECYTISPTTPEVKAYMINARSSTCNARLFIQKPTASETENANEEVIGKDIINSDYLLFTKEQLTGNKLCLRRSDKNDSNYVGVQFQLFNLDDLTNSQPRNEALIRGVMANGYLPENSVMYYRLLKYAKSPDLSGSTFLGMHLHIKRGKPIFYYYRCTSYPLCTVKPEDIPTLTIPIKKIHDVNDFYSYSLNVQSGDPYLSQYQDTALVYCAKGTDCEYEVIINNGNFDDYLLYDSVKIAKPIGFPLTDYYTFTVTNADTKRIEVVLYSFVGNSDFKLEKEGVHEIGKYSFNGNKEVITCENTAKEGETNTLLGTYYISVKAITNSYYHIYYSTSNTQEVTKDKIASGEMMLSTVNQKEKSKLIVFNNRSISAKTNYFATISLLNCEGKITYKDTESTKRQNLYFIPSTEEPTSIAGEYEFKVELTSLDSKSKNAEENCLIYAIGDELIYEKEIVLNEGITHSMTLSKDIKSIVYLYPFYFNSKYSESEQIVVLFNKINAGSLKMSYAFELSELKELDVARFPNRKIGISHEDIVKQCSPDNLCSLIIKVESKDEFPIDFSLQIMSSHKVPSYLENGLIKFDGVYGLNNYQYYYTDIAKDQKGEVWINFTKGSGHAVAKIVRKDFIAEEPDWNQRVRLPKENDDDLLEYDSVVNRIILPESKTIECDVIGCEMYIGVYSKDQRKSSLKEYSIVMKSSESNIKIKPNEYAYGLLSKSQGEYYTITIKDPNKKMMIDFINEYGLCYINYGTKKPTQTEFDWKVEGKGEMLTISASDPKISKETLKDATFTFSLFSTIVLPIDANYAFKVITNHIEDLPMMVEGKIGEEINCQIEGDRCYIFIPIYQSDKMQQLALYASNINSPFTKNSIYTSLIKQRDYEVMTVEEISKKIPNEQSKDYTNEKAYNANSLLISFATAVEDGYLLISVVSPVKGKINLLSTINAAQPVEDLKPKVKELFILPPKSELKIGILGQETYIAEMSQAEGVGSISNNLRSAEYIVDQKNRDISMVVKSIQETKAQIIAKSIGEEYFLFVLEYSLRPDVFLDLVQYGKFNTIESQKFFVFPLFYYLPINDEDYDVTINLNYISFELGTEINLHNQDFVLKGHLINEDTITKLKINPKEAIEGQSLASYYDSSIRLGELHVLASTIKASTIQGKKYIYFSLEPSPENKNSYAEFTTKILAYQTKPTLVPAYLPSNYYFFSKPSLKDPQFIKMIKQYESDTKMEVNVALVSKQYAFTFNKYNDNPSSVNYKQNDGSLILKSEEINGVVRTSIDLGNAPNGILFSIFASTNSHNNEEDSQGNYAVQYITYKDTLQHLLVDTKLTHEFNNSNYTITLNTVTDKNQKPALSNYAMRLYPNTTTTNVLNEKNSFYIHEAAAKMNTLARVQTKTVTFKGEDLPEKGVYYISIVSRGMNTNNGNGNSFEEFISYPILKTGKDDPFNPDPREKSNWWIWVLAGAGGVIVICGIVGLVYFLITKKKQDKGAEYEDIGDKVDQINL